MELAATAYARLFKDVKGALALYFSLLAVSIMLILIMVFSPDKPTAAEEVRLDIGASILFSLVVAGFCIVRRAELTPVLRRTGHWGWYLAAPVAAGFTFAIAAALVTAMNFVLHLPSMEYSDSYRQVGFGLWVPLLTIAVQPAIFEELAFRGLIGGGIERALGVRDGLIVTALLFAVLHLSALSLVHLSIIGLALGLLRRRSGSLYPGMLMHFTHNALVVLAEFFVSTPHASTPSP